MTDQISKHFRGPNAHTEFGRLAAEFDQLHLPTLSESLFPIYEIKAKELVMLAQMTHDASKIDFATATFAKVHYTIKNS